MSESSYKEFRLSKNNPIRPIHGSIKLSELRALGLAYEDVLDFSTNINPLGPPESVFDGVEDIDLSKYPDPECLHLHEMISKHLDIDTSFILAGNGSTEIIHLFTRAYFESISENSRTCAIFGPTYGEYRGASELMGVSILNLTANLIPPFDWDWSEAYSLIAKHKPALVSLCNPNNPTGVYLDESHISNLASVVSENNGLLIVDEAYINFVEDRWDAIHLVRDKNIALLRSMTKDYSLTGIRLGYVLATPDIIEKISIYQPDWSVNSIAQQAGINVLQNKNYLQHARDVVKKNKAYLTSELTSLNFQVHVSQANFLLLRTGNAGSWRNRLLQKGIVVRDCTSFGLPDYIRIGIRPFSECRQLVNTMMELVEV